MITGKPKLLLVDDEPLILDALQRSLRASFEVRTATSGTAGLELLAVDKDFAVVMSDMRMPLMNGAAFLSRARTLAPDTVRMLLTGQADVETAVGALRAGAWDFVTKPLVADTVAEVVADEAYAIQPGDQNIAIGRR